MQILPSPIRPGDRVVVRRQPWRVLSVRAFEHCQVVALAGTGPGNLGVERQVLTPFDTVEPHARRKRLVRVGLRRWRKACRNVIQSSGPSGALHTAERARMHLLPHQLEPALAVTSGIASRVLIADEVGLGKTIQAGLILAELVARLAADRALVLTPAGLRDQWADELASRFSLHAVVLDARETRRRMAWLPPGTNPWTTTPIAIASIDYVKRPEVLPAVQACRWDLVVVDEAHIAASASDRHQAVTALCRAAPAVVLLTATPHSGDTAAFQSLCRIGSHGNGDQLLVFRRTRRDVAVSPARHVHSLLVCPTAAEQCMHAELAALSATVRRDEANAWLVLTLLHKRALSSARSLEQSVARRLAAINELAPAAERSDGQLLLPLTAAGEANDDDVSPVWTTPLIDDPHTERRLLVRLARAAVAATIDESKLSALARLLVRLHRRGEPAIVFTEYRDTLAHVRERLCRLPALSTVVLHGGLSRADRLTALQSFSDGRANVLLATDAAGEGLNLHHRCRVVINLELPWNPARLEQRIGRVDRIGQRRTVHAFHLVAGGTGEARLFARLAARIARAQHDIGAADPLAPHVPDTEAAVSRWILDGVEPTAHQADVSADDTRPGRLAADAAIERARLTYARLLAEAGGSDLTPDGHTLVARTHRSKTRQALHGRHLSVAQTTWESATGHQIASHLSAAVHPSSLSPAPPTLAPSMDHTIRALQAHQQFWEARLRREQQGLADLQESTYPSGAAALQPGLFDQRAEREAAGARAQFDEAVHDAQLRIEAAHRAADVSVQPTRVVLVLET